MFVEEELDEASKQYMRTLEERLINKFKKEFFEKIGYTPHVIALNQNKSDTPVIELQQIIDSVNTVMESKFGNVRVNNKLIRITSFLRSREATEYRFIYFKLAREMGYSYKEIGRALKTDKTDGYDHTTVIYGVNTFNDLLGTSEKFALKYQEVVDFIKDKFLNN